jgi:hypothetical protein
VEVATDWYDINPLRFNERGVNLILHWSAIKRIEKGP